jgi:hypothetical protein
MPSSGQAGCLHIRAAQRGDQQLDALTIAEVRQCQRDAEPHERLRIVEGGDQRLGQPRLAEIGLLNPFLAVMPKLHVS